MLLLIAGIGQLIGCIVNLIAIAWIASHDNNDINNDVDVNVPHAAKTPPPTLQTLPPAPPLPPSTTAPPLPPPPPFEPRGYTTAVCCAAQTGTWVVAVLALLCSLGAGKHMHTYVYTVCNCIYILPAAPG